MSQESKNQTKQQLVSVRFSLTKYIEFLTFAEELKMNRSEFINHIYDLYKKKKVLDTDMTNFSKRLENRIFEMVAAIAGLDEQESLKAKKKYLSNLRKQSK